MFVQTNSFPSAYWSHHLASYVLEIGLRILAVGKLRRLFILRC